MIARPISLPTFHPQLPGNMHEGWLHSGLQKMKSFALNHQALYQHSTFIHLQEEHWCSFPRKIILEYTGIHINHFLKKTPIASGYFLGTNITGDCNRFFWMAELYTTTGHVITKSLTSIQVKLTFN